LNRQSGDEGVCHRLWQSHHRHGQTGKQIGLDVVPLVLAQPRNKGKDVVDMNVHTALPQAEERTAAGRKFPVYDRINALFAASGHIQSQVLKKALPTRLSFYKCAEHIHRRRWVERILTLKSDPLQLH
jgi:hypothetical protein